MSTKSKLVVIGNGMVGHKLVEALHARDGLDAWEATVFCEEPRLAYDRVNLSTIFAGKQPDDLALARAEWYAERGITVRVGDRAVEIAPSRSIAPSGWCARPPAGRSPTTASCWPPGPIPSFRRWPVATCPGASCTAPSRTWSRSEPTPPT
jgi:NADPH-dependent 2,4-dienoyl-CoA reductase/sulfur reductase-like enzyme